MEESGEHPVDQQAAQQQLQQNQQDLQSHLDTTSPNRTSPPPQQQPPQQNTEQFTSMDTSEPAQVPNVHHSTPNLSSQQPPQPASGNAAAAAADTISIKQEPTDTEHSQPGSAGGEMSTGSQQDDASNHAHNNEQQASHSSPSLSKSNILEAIEDFDSSIPDAVVHHFLNSSGMRTSDPRIIKLIAVAAQKFIHDIVSDSLQHCKLRGAQGKKTKEKKFTLAIEDLSAALAEYGIEVRRQQYFS